MADQNFMDLASKTASGIAGTDYMMLVNNSEAYKALVNDVAEAILSKLTSKSFSGLETTAKNVIGALNELNSKTFQKSNEIITSGVDWNTINEAGVYKVQCANGFAEGKNTPMITSTSDFYNFGILLVFKPVVDNENRLIQIYIPDIQPEQPSRARIAIRSFNSSFRMWGMIKVENTL